jgi:hypothetical protein
MIPGSSFPVHDAADAGCHGRNATHLDAAPSALIKTLAALTPESQGDIDVSLIEENLRLTPAQRIQAACRAATDLEILRSALKARHG